MEPKDPDYEPDGSVHAVGDAKRREVNNDNVKLLEIRFSFRKLVLPEC